jgi:hypothetical protein
MVRYLLAFVLLICSQLALANDIATFFDQLEGNWTLDKGFIIKRNRYGSPISTKISKLNSRVEKTAPNEWRFSEEYCEDTCTESTFTYVLENGSHLYLVSDEGKQPLVVMSSDGQRLIIRNITNNFQSQIECEIYNGMFYQRGFTILPDFSNIQTEIDLKRP